MLRRPEGCTHGAPVLQGLDVREQPEHKDDAHKAELHAHAKRRICPPAHRQRVPLATAPGPAWRTAHGARFAIGMHAFFILGISSWSICTHPKSDAAFVTPAAERVRFIGNRTLGRGMRSTTVHTGGDSWALLCRTSARRPGFGRSALGHKLQRHDRGGRLEAVHGHFVDD
jgi:hypothetical protein